MHRFIAALVGIAAFTACASNAQAARFVPDKSTVQVTTTMNNAKASTAQTATASTTQQAIDASEQYQLGNKIVTYSISNYKVGPETLRLEPVKTPDYTGLNYVLQKHKITKIVKHGSLSGPKSYKTYFTLDLKPGLKIVSSYIAYEMHFCKDPKHAADGKCPVADQASTTRTYSNLLVSTDRVYYIEPGDGYLAYLTVTLEDPSWNFHWPLPDPNCSNKGPVFEDCTVGKGGE